MVCRRPAPSLHNPLDSLQSITTSPPKVSSQSLCVSLSKWISNTVIMKTADFLFLDLIDIVLFLFFFSHLFLIFPSKAHLLNPVSFICLLLSLKPLNSLFQSRLYDVWNLIMRLIWSVMNSVLTKNEIHILYVQEDTHVKLIHTFQITPQQTCQTQSIILTIKFLYRLFFGVYL